MKTFLKSFFVALSLVMFLLPSLQAQQGAVFGRKVIRNFKEEAFQVVEYYGVGAAGYGSFRDFEGNLYVYGNYQGSGKNNKIDNVVLNELSSDKYILIKFDKDYKAVWGHAFDGIEDIMALKIFQGPDSLLYIFVTSFNDFRIGNLQVVDNTAGQQNSTFLVKMDAKTGTPISGTTLPKTWMKISLNLRDAVVDDKGNIYVAMATFTPYASPDSIKVGPFKMPWRENKFHSNMGLIIKFDKNINPLWMHTVGGLKDFEAVLSVVNNELIVVGTAESDPDFRWKKIYFDNELLVDMDFNKPYGQYYNSFLLKLDSNGNKKWIWPWLVKYPGDSYGIGMFDMDTDPEGNIYVFLSSVDLETKLDTSWFTPKVHANVKMAKFNPDGYLEWLREPVITRSYSDLPGTSVNNMLVDKYGNSYYTFEMPYDIRTYSLDSFKFSQPWITGAFGDTYIGLIKLNKDGHAVSGYFPPLAKKAKNVRFNNSFKIAGVDDNGTIYFPFTVNIHDTFYVYHGDTLYQHFNVSKNRYMDSWYWINTELIPDAQLIKDYKSPSCSSSQDGYIHLKVLGGASGHLLKWSDGKSDLNRDNLSSGVYIISLYDSTAQTTTVDTILLKAPAPITGIAQTQDDSVNLHIGFIHITLRGGTPPYTLQWNDPGNSSTASIDQLAAGSYTLTVTDARQCSWDTTIVLQNKTNSIREQNRELSVYPNPSKDGSLYLKMTDPKSAFVEVIIMDAEGKECFHKRIDNSGKVIRTKLPVKLSQGNYLVKIVDGEEIYLRKISVM